MKRDNVYPNMKNIEFLHSPKFF